MENGSWAIAKPFCKAIEQSLHYVNVTQPSNNLSRIERTVHPSTTPVEYMGIDHRRLYIFMSQQLLHRADVIAVLQPMCGKAMTKRVAANTFIAPTA